MSWFDCLFAGLVVAALVMGTDPTTILAGWAAFNTLVIKNRTTTRADRCRQLAARIGRECRLLHQRIDKLA